MNKIIKDKFYKSENSTLIVKALETTISSLFEGEVIDDWCTESFYEIEHTEQSNHMFPIY